MLKVASLLLRARKPAPTTTAAPTATPTAVQNGHRLKYGDGMASGVAADKSSPLLPCDAGSATASAPAAAGSGVVALVGGETAAVGEVADAVAHALEFSASSKAIDVNFGTTARIVAPRLSRQGK